MRETHLKSFQVASEPAWVQLKEHSMPPLFAGSLPSPSIDRRRHALKIHARRLLLAILVVIALLLALAFVPEHVHAIGSLF